MGAGSCLAGGWLGWMLVLELVNAKRKGDTRAEKDLFGGQEGQEKAEKQETPDVTGKGR